MRRAAAAAVLLAAAVLSAACSNSKPTPQASKSTSSPTPPAGTGVLTKGRAHLVVTGALSATVNLPLDVSQTQYHGPDKVFAAFWKDGKNNLLSFGGTAFSGKRKTAQGLVLGFNATQGTTFGYATSSNGECTITMTSSASKISGSFTCSNVKTGEKTYDATGTFDATA